MSPGENKGHYSKKCTWITPKRRYLSSSVNSSRSYFILSHSAGSYFHPPNPTQATSTRLSLPLITPISQSCLLFVSFFPHRMFFHISLRDWSLSFRGGSFLCRHAVETFLLVKTPPPPPPPVPLPPTCPTPPPTPALTVGPCSSAAQSCGSTWPVEVLVGVLSAIEVKSWSSPLVLIAELKVLAIYWVIN